MKIIKRLRIRLALPIMIAALLTGGFAQAQKAEYERAETWLGGNRRLARSDSLGAMIVRPIAGTGRWQSIGKPIDGVELVQKFRVIDASWTTKRREVLLRVIPVTYYENHHASGWFNVSPFQETNIPVYKELPEGRTYLALTPVTAKEDVTQSVVAKALVTTDTLKFVVHGSGRKVFETTLVKEFAKADSTSRQRLARFFGLYFQKNASLASCAFVADPDDEVGVGNEALRLASNAKDSETKLCLLLIAGKFGQADGFEPFLSEIKKQYDANSNSIKLDLMTRVIPFKVDLTHVLREVPPTRSNQEMLDFALSFNSRPDVTGFLNRFVTYDFTASPVSKESVIKLYLTAEKCGNKIDEWNIYNSISTFLERQAPGDGSPESTLLRMCYPVGLLFDNSELNMVAWKSALDSYLGVKRRNQPL